MNHLDASPTSLTLSPALPAGRRLLVLIPGPEIDPVLTAHRVRDLAIASQARIRFIGLSPDPAGEPALRRQMVDLSAMVSDGQVCAETEVVPGKAWLEAIRSRWQAGDLVVCFAGQKVGPWNRPLSQVLQVNLDVPLFILSRIEPQSRSQSNRLARAAAWIGAFGIVLGFLLLQIRIGIPRNDWTYYSLFAVSIGAEVWALWYWNSLFD
jgi:hypothetical protein